MAEVNALLINGPRHLHTLKMDSTPPFIVVPQTMPLLIDALSYPQDPRPVFATTIYSKYPGTVGGFVLYLAEEK